MTKEVKNRSVAKHSTNTLTPAGATSVQVIHQIIIPETPTGLIGEKVIWTEKYERKYPEDAQIGRDRVNTPYFTIIDAWLEMRTKGIIVMVKVDIPGTQWKCYGLMLSHFKKYEGHV
jgi:hypothetical protein